MLLFIRNTTGNTISLKVCGSDTFDLVMAKILGMCSCCFHKCSCFPSIIDQMQLVIRTNSTGKSIILDVRGWDTFDLVKETLEDTCSVAIRWELIPKPVLWWPGSLLIFVRIHNDHNLKTITIALQPRHTILDLVYAIRSKECILPYRQDLFLAGMSLDRDRTLASYNIDPGSTLDVVLKGQGVGGEANVFVETTDGKKIPLTVDDELSIKEVKVVIQHETGIPQVEQRLVYDEHELEEANLIADYSIRDNAIFRLVNDASLKRKVAIRIHIQIAVTQKTIRLNVVTTDTILTVKAMIQAKEHIPMDQQVLFLPSKRLHDHKLTLVNGGIQEDKFTLVDYFIQDGSTLYLAQIFGHSVIIT